MQDQVSKADKGDELFKLKEPSEDDRKRFGLD